MANHTCICQRLKLAVGTLNKLEWITPPEFDLHQYSCATIDLVRVVVRCITTHYCNLDGVSQQQHQRLRDQKQIIGEEIQTLQQSIYPQIANFYRKAAQYHQLIEAGQQCQEDQLENYYSQLVDSGLIQRQDVIPICRPTGYINRQGVEDALNWYPSSVTGSGNPADGDFTDPLESTPTGTGVDLDLWLQQEQRLDETLSWVQPSQDNTTIDFWKNTLPAVTELQHQIKCKCLPDLTPKKGPVERILDHPKASETIRLPFNQDWKTQITAMIQRRNKLLECIVCCQ